MPTTATTGKDITLTLSFNGDRVDECAAIDFTVRPDYNTIEVEPLGKDETERDHEFRGFSGTITFVERDPRLQRFIDSYNLFLRNRLPFDLTMTVTKNYRDGSTITHVYRKLYVEFESSYRRGEANRSTCNWTTGLDREEIGA